LSRHASQQPGGFDCDYNDEAGFRAALQGAVLQSGPIDLAVAWFHTLKIAAPRMLAQEMRGRMFQVLGSATADPAHPHRLATAATVADGLADCRLRQVVLGFRVIDGGSRWLTNDEISAGVLDAVRNDRPLSVIGQVEPWSARP
ncbi:MAG: hypothetical protein ACREEO_05160, partial [Phenylobacterium sp.]